MIQAAFNSFLAALLMIPAATQLCRRDSKMRRLPALLLLFVLLVGALVAGVSFWRGDRLALDLSWATPFPFALTVDRLSAFFLLLICAVGAPVALFSISYVERHYSGSKADWMGALLPLFVLSMALVVTASTAFAFLFGWELMTLFSAGLILIDGDSERRRHNIFIYLLMMHAGAAAVIASFFSFPPPCKRSRLHRHARRRGVHADGIAHRDFSVVVCRLWHQGGHRSFSPLAAQGAPYRAQPGFGPDVLAEARRGGATWFCWPAR